MTPSRITLAGKIYPLAPVEDAYEKLFEVIRAGRKQIVGASTAEEVPESDILEWKIDDWSAGEGFRILNPEPGHPSLRGYYESSAGVDVSVPGQVRCGRGVMNSFSDTDTVLPANGPFLAVTEGDVWVAYNNEAKQLTDPNNNTWTNRATGMGTDNIVGPISGFGGSIYIAGPRNAANGGVRKVSATGNTQWVAEAGRSPLVADNRVYYLARGTTSSTMRRIGLDAAGTASTAYTMLGVGSSNGDSAPMALTSIGSDIYALSGDFNEDARLHIFQSNAGRELAVFRSLRCDPRINANFGWLDVIQEVGGLIFTGGWNSDGTAGEVRFYSPASNSWDSLGTIRGVQGQTSGRVTALGPGKENEVLIALDLPTPAIFRYDLRAGGLSMLMTASTTISHATSVAFHHGDYYLASTSGAGSVLVDRSRGFATTKITQPIWHFGFPNTEKILESAEVHAKTVGASETIAVSFKLDDGSELTTDSAGNTVSMSSTDGARKKFTLTDADTERVFRFMEPFITLTPAVPNGAASTSSTLYSVTFRARPVAQVAAFRVILDFSRESHQPSAAYGARSVEGALRELETLLGNTADRVWKFRPFVEDPERNPGGTSEEHDVMLRTARWVHQGQGKAYYELVLDRMS